MTIPDRKRSKAQLRENRVSTHFDGSHEPGFKQKYPYWLVGGGGQTLELEIFKFRVWRTFREHTTHWPVVSIGFHFASGIAMFAGIVLWGQMTKEWSGLKTWASFIIGLSLWIVVSEVGIVTARKLDWKLFGRK